MYLYNPTLYNYMYLYNPTLYNYMYLYYPTLYNYIHIPYTLYLYALYRDHSMTVIITHVIIILIGGWNQSAGHSQLTSAKAIENLKKWEGVIEITDELLNLVKEEETGKNNNYSLVLNTCYICTASV